MIYHLFDHGGVLVNRHVDVIFSEDPENDLWRELLQFTYKKNIEDFLKKNDHTSEENLINNIAGSFLQANEYFKSAEKTNLQITPLLLYYGATNLLNGMTNLINGNICKINNHGMSLEISNDSNDIAEMQVGFFDAKAGGVHIFAKALGYEEKLTDYGEWKLKEFLDSIAEIDDDFKKCYGVSVGQIIMLDVINTPDGRVERAYFFEGHGEDVKRQLYNVKDFEKSYLKIESGRDIHSEKKYFILRQKINGKGITETSFSGQPYLKAAHKKNGNLITLPTIIDMYIILFALAKLCRYHPGRWSRFVLNDETGERLLIEKFLYYSKRIIPNIVLNILSGGEIQYVSNRYQPIETTKFVGEHQIKEIVEKEINEKLEKENYITNSLKGNK